MKRYRAAAVFYLFNVFNSQTGYAISPNFNDALYGRPLRYFDPRRAELTFRLAF